MEFIDILDEDGNPTGEIKEKDAVHNDGDWHKEVQIFVINGEEIILQQQPKEKDDDPGKWSSTASGHIRAGEKSSDAAIKEFSKEIGVKIDTKDLVYVDTLKSSSIGFNKGNKILNNRFVDLYVVTKKVNVEDLVVQKEEVENVKSYKIDEFVQMVHNRDERLTDTPILFDRLVDYLKK